MHSTYKEALEVCELQEQVSEMTNNILDLYKRNPEACKKMLLELDDVNKELDKLEKDYELILKQL